MRTGRRSALLRLLLGALRKVERVEGGFKLRAAGKVEAAFTGFTVGIDLLGPGVSLTGDDALALLRRLLEGARAAA